MRQLFYLYKIVSTKQPAYLYDLISFFQRSWRNRGYSYEPFCRTVSPKISFLLYAVKEWNKLDLEIRNAEAYASFQKLLLSFIRTKGNNTCKIYDPLRKKLLTKSRLGFSQLLEHSFRHNFTDSLNPLCFFSLETESTIHFFLHSQNYATVRRTPMTESKDINDTIMFLNENDLLHVVMYGNKNFNNNLNITTPGIKFSKDSERFDQPLLNHSYFFIHILFELFTLYYN